MIALYELLILIPFNLDVKNIINNVNKIIYNNNIIIYNKFLGLKKILYKIKNYNKVYFHFLIFKTQNIKLINNKLKNNFNIIRYLIIKLNKHSINYYNKYI